MKTDELAFFNQQLALMLRDGIPLEGALRQLAGGMRQGAMRTEIQALEADLARGTPLREALPKRNLPTLYQRMVAAGAASRDMPGMLTMLADHYQRSHALFSRLKGLMVYPMIVIGVSLVLTVVLSLAFRKFALSFEEAGIPQQKVMLMTLWVGPVLLTLAAILLLAAVYVPRLRSYLRWKIPAFREASLAQLASALALMLRSGTPLPEALELAASLESNSPASRALLQWRTQIVAGQGRVTEWEDITGTLPRLFTWMVRSSQQDPATGFQKTADLYQARAAFRTEMLLYGVLPISIIFLGQLVFWQFAPVLQSLVRMMNMIGDMSGM